MLKVAIRFLGLVILGAALVVLNAPQVTHAAVNLVADYQFNDSRSSSVGSAPNLVDIGTNSFASETVGSQTCQVLTFAGGHGVSLATNGLISSSTYSLVLLFRIQATSGYRKLVDFSNGSQDYGLYNDSQELVFYTDDLSSPSVFSSNTYAQVVLTRDGTTKQVLGYFNGTQEVSFTDTNSRAVIDASNKLRFFIDDNQTGVSEDSAGAVARIRVYDGVLSPSQVAALDGEPANCDTQSFTTIQNTSPLVRYNGWQGVTDVGASGGSYRQAQSSADTASVAFSGTSVKYFYRAASNMGKADLYVDSKKVKSLCSYAASSSFKSTTIKNLASGKHTLEVRVLNQKCNGSKGTWVSIDKIVVGSTTIEDTALKWNWSGWTNKSAAAASGGNYATSKTAGAFVLLAFQGTRVQVLLLKGPSFGKLDVFIDLAKVETLNLNNSTVIAFSKTYSGLSNANHTITLRRNTGSGSKAVVVDGFRVPTPAP